jgi:hypothetical protein
VEFSASDDRLCYRRLGAPLGVLGRLVLIDDGLAGAEA